MQWASRCLPSVSGHFTLFLGYTDSKSVLVLDSRHLLLSKADCIEARTLMSIFKVLAEICVMCNILVRYKIISVEMTKNTGHLIDQQCYIFALHQAETEQLRLRLQVKESQRAR